MTQSDPPKVSDYMTEVPAVVETGMRIGDALDRMYRANIRHLPVVDEGRALVGVISTRDIAGAALLGLDPANARVESVMSRAVYACAVETPLVEVVEHMERERIGSAVVTRAGEPCGMFTTTDALRALRCHLRGRPVEPLVHPAVVAGPEDEGRPVAHPHIHAAGASPGDSMVSWFLARL